MSEYVVWLDDKRKDIVDTDAIYKVSRPAEIKEPVVRCRDCKNFTPKGTHKFNDGFTNAEYCKYVRGFMLQITPNGFCAWGERRES